MYTYLVLSRRRASQNGCNICVVDCRSAVVRYVPNSFLMPPLTSTLVR